MRMTHTVIRGIASLFLGFLCALGPAANTEAQTANLVQPWGLPPLPPGVGPLEKFADISGTPQGQFLEGGAFDTQGNLWFVAIGSDTGRPARPGFQLQPAARAGADLRAAGHPLVRGQALFDDAAPRHPGL